MPDDKVNNDKHYQEYIDRFGVWPPTPMCVDESEILKQVKVALERGQPIPEDYDWYSQLPPGALA